MTRAAVTTLDPADGAAVDSFGRRSITSLLFDTLVSIDDSGASKPGLAESWQTTRASQRWEFRLRQGVKFQDGTPLTAEIVAASLRAANPSWNVSVGENGIAIERDATDSELLAELALQRNSIIKRDTDKVVGTGPFQVVEWQPGKKLTVTANENYWRGRPYLDAIEIEMGKSFHDQMAALEMRKADLVEVVPEQTHRLLQEGRRLTRSAPEELLALVFSRDAASPEERTLRQALALSVERGSIRNVLLQGDGEPSGGLLPTWISGYGFVFPTGADLPKARQLRDQVRTVPAWKVGYESSDALARLLAERIALNARDAGLSLQPTAAASSDMHVVRIPIASGDPWLAFDELLAQAGLPAPKNQSGSLQELLTSEQAMLAGGRVIPLFHLPVSYAATENLKDWTLRIDGSWALGDAWLENARP